MTISSVPSMSSRLYPISSPSAPAPYGPAQAGGGGSRGPASIARVTEGGKPVAKSGLASASKDVAAPAVLLAQGVATANKLAHEVLREYRKLAATPEGRDKIALALVGKPVSELGPQGQIAFKKVLDRLAGGAALPKIVIAASGSGVSSLPPNVMGAYSAQKNLIILAPSLKNEDMLATLREEFGEALAATAAKAFGATSQAAKGDAGARLASVLAGKPIDAADFKDSAFDRVKLRINGVEVTAAARATASAESRVGSIPLNRDGYYVTARDQTTPTLNAFLNSYAADDLFERKKTLTVSGINVSGRDKKGAKLVKSGPWREGVWIYKGGHVMVQTLASGIQVVRDAKRGETMVVDMKTGETQTYRLKAGTNTFEPVKNRQSFGVGSYRMVAGFTDEGKPIWMTVAMDKSQVASGWLSRRFTTSMTVSALQARGSAIFSDDSPELLKLRAANVYAAPFAFFKGRDVNESRKTADVASDLMREAALMGALMDQGAGNAAHNAVKAAGQKNVQNMRQFNSLLHAESKRNGDLINWLDTKARPEWANNAGAQKERLIAAIGGKDVAKAMLREADELIQAYGWKPESVQNAKERVRNALYVYRMLGNEADFAARQKRVDDGNLIKSPEQLLDAAYTITGTDAESNAAWREIPRNLKQVKTAVSTALTGSTKGTYGTDLYNGTTINGTAVGELGKKLDKPSADRLADAYLKAGKPITNFMRLAVSAARTAGAAGSLANYLATKYPNGEGLPAPIQALWRVGRLTTGRTGAALWSIITSTWLLAEGVTIAGRVKKGIANSSVQMAALALRGVGYGVGVAAWGASIYMGIRNNANGLPTFAQAEAGRFKTAIYGFTSALAANAPWLVPLGMGTGDLGAEIGILDQAKLDLYAAGKQDPNRPRGKGEANAGFVSGSSLGFQTLTAYVAAYGISKKKPALVASMAGLNAVMSWVDLSSRSWRDVLYFMRA